MVGKASQSDLRLDVPATDDAPGQPVDPQCALSESVVDTVHRSLASQGHQMLLETNTLLVATLLLGALLSVTVRILTQTDVLSAFAPQYYGATPTVSRVPHV